MSETDNLAMSEIEKENKLLKQEQDEAKNKQIRIKEELAKKLISGHLGEEISTIVNSGYNDPVIVIHVPWYKRFIKWLGKFFHINK